MVQILRAAAVDLSPESGCDACALGRDEVSGWGKLDVAAAIAALTERLPVRDSYEANDDSGSRAYEVFGANRMIKATVDFWDDQDDVYAIHLQRNQPVYVGLTGSDPSVDLSLAFWLPGVRSIESVSSIRFRARVSARAGSRQYLSFRARAAGIHFVQVRMSSPGVTRYRLAVVKG